MSLSDAMSDAFSDKNLMLIVWDLHFFVVSFFSNVRIFAFRILGILDGLEFTPSFFYCRCFFQISDFGFPGFPDFGCLSVRIRTAFLILRMYSVAFAGVPARAGACGMAKLVVLIEW